MSEVEQILNKFHHARHAERTTSGVEPSVCVAGWIDYHALESALLLKYKDILKDTGHRQGFNEYIGVKIYPSRSIEEGFYFGHIEP